MRRSALALSVLLLASPALAIDMGTPSSAGAADLAPARAAIAQENWQGAANLLQPIVQAEPRNADALNLMGFVLRKSGNLPQAGRYYDAALQADPNHLGALEYQGELFLMQGDRAGAEANLLRLTQLCGGCEERQDLAAALAGS